MILKFTDVTAEQLARLRDFVDADSNMADPQAEETRPTVRLLKTNVNTSGRPTSWTVHLDVCEMSRNADGRRITTPRSIVFDLLDILDRFPVEPRVIDNVTTASAPRGGPPCRNCGSPTIPQGAAFQCRNCGEKTF